MALESIDRSFNAGRIAGTLLARGYSVLLFDLRGHGESEGLRCGLGEKEAFDVAAIRPVDQVKALPQRAFLFIHCEEDSAEWEARVLAFLERELGR